MIPGMIISILTFPGVIVHEFAHQLMCYLLRIRVFEVCYFRMGNPSGYVIHEPTQNPIDNILIGIGPFLINTIAGALISIPSSIQVMTFDNGNPLDYILIWLGVSITMHSFPSMGDAQSIWQTTFNHSTPFYVKLLGAPIVTLIYLVTIGSFFWLDLFYGIAVIKFLPNLIVGIFI